MAVEIIITSNFAEVASRFEAAAAEAPAEIEAGLAEAAAAARDVVVPILADNTPKKSGALAASTTGDLEVGGMEATIDLRQPATSADGIEYWVFPEFGRGDVYPHDPAHGALWDGAWPHPWKHSKPAPAQHYVETAIDAMSGPLDSILAEQAGEMAGKIIAVLG